MYGTPISVVGRHFVKQKDSSGDPSVDALIYIALAHHAVEQLALHGVDISWRSGNLVLSSLERAYAELLFVRKNMPDNMIDDKVISKFGRLR